jgi:hypothetical protein
MTNESEKKLLKLIKQEVFSSEITNAIEEVLETISVQRKQRVLPSPFQRPKSFKRWTKEEETKLVESFLEGTTLDKIALEHERSCNAIFQRLAFPQFLRHISQRSLMSAFELKGTDLI